MGLNEEIEKVDQEIKEKQAMYKAIEQSLKPLSFKGPCWRLSSLVWSNVAGPSPLPSQVSLERALPRCLDGTFRRWM